jgi:purine-cytosine permease-like protein
VSVINAQQVYGVLKLLSGLPDILKPKIPIWVNFGVSCNGRCWYILWPFGLFYIHLVYYVAILYILWLFGIFLVYFLSFGMLHNEKSGNPGFYGARSVRRSVSFSLTTVHPRHDLHIRNHHGLMAKGLGIPQA